METKEAKPFRGGLPYAPDVKRLTEAFPVSELQEGKVITHEELEPIVKAKRGTQRYYSVVDSWTAKQRNENGIYIVWVQGTGIKVLNPAEILQHGETKVRQKIKQTGRAVRTFAWVDRERLDDIGQKRYDHQCLVAQRINESLNAARKELAIDLAPVKSLPKPKLVKNAS